MREQRASPVTIQRAVTQLVREGRLVTRPGDGTFVAQPMRAARPLDVVLAVGRARRSRRAPPSSNVLSPYHASTLVNAAAGIRTRRCSRSLCSTRTFSAQRAARDVVAPSGRGFSELRVGSRAT